MISFIKHVIRTGLKPFKLMWKQSPQFENIFSLLKSENYQILKTAPPQFEKMLSLLKSENYQFLRRTPPGHFYSPIPDIKEIRSKSKAGFDQSAKEIPGVDINKDTQLSLADRFIAFYGEIPFTDNKVDHNRYYFDNSYFSYGDGLSLYSMMRLFKPKRIVEVGSGFSSAAMLDTDERFFRGQIEFTFIEPYPDRLLSLLTNKDMEQCKILKEPVQKVPIYHFDNLCENDFLFIDSSHVAKMHSDVLHNIFTILPSLKKGVLVHFHDILWPFEYPQNWLDYGRAWNEAYFVRAFMQYNKSFEILYSNSYMEFHHEKFLRDNMPLMLKTPSSDLSPGNTSLWIRKIL